MVDETTSDAIPGFAGRDALVRARVGVTAIFFANGLAIWAVAIPQIKTLFALSDGGLSLILLAAGVSRLNGWPMPPPADASQPTSQSAAHGSGPVWCA